MGAGDMGWPQAHAGPEPTFPEEVAGFALAVGPIFAIILYGHNLPILLIISNYR